MFVLFIYTAPSSKVPKKLYFSDGNVWYDNPKQATMFNSRGEAIKVASDYDDYDLQIEEV